MSRGVTLYNFTRTRYGTLSDVDLKKPGNFLFFVVGLAQGSNVLETVHVNDDFTYQFPNPRWAGITTSFAAFQLLLNPLQSRSTCRGKMMLDLSPKVYPIWLGSFLDCWFKFIRLNPHVSDFLCFIISNIFIYSLKFLPYMFLPLLFIMAPLVCLLIAMNLLVILDCLLFLLVIVYVSLPLCERF